MASLADSSSELIGFFSYSREDDEDSGGALSALRDRIQRELRGQLGLRAGNFRLWQDKESIAPGRLWEAEIKAAIGQSVFFIPIITPTVVSSEYRRVEFDSFLERERLLGRSDLVFPILYIRVAGLEDAAKRKADGLLSTIAQRQYVDWRELRHRDVNSEDVRKAIARFCAKIADALTVAVAGTASSPPRAPAPEIPPASPAAPAPAREDRAPAATFGAADQRDGAAAAAEPSPAAPVRSSRRTGFNLFELLGADPALSPIAGLAIAFVFMDSAATVISIVLRAVFHNVLATANTGFNFLISIVSLVVAYAVMRDVKWIRIPAGILFLADAWACFHNIGTYPSAPNTVEVVSIISNGQLLVGYLIVSAVFLLRPTATLAEWLSQPGVLRAAFLMLMVLTAAGWVAVKLALFANQASYALDVILIAAACLVIGISAYARYLRPALAAARPR